MTDSHAEPHLPSGRNFFWLLAALPLALAGGLVSLLAREDLAEGIRFGLPWVAGLDVNLAFYFDGLSVLMGLLVTGVGSLVLIYASGYMQGSPQIKRFFGILTFFMFAMLGLVLADNIVLLFIFWELTSISSYLLIGFNHRVENARESALQALLVTGSGGVVLMAGLVTLAIISGEWELSAMLQEAESFGEHPLFFVALALLLIGAFTKSAQFPFHFWLPNAMAGPTPVSAYLHSATMVKAGVYLLARIAPIFGHNDVWLVVLTAVGGTTMLLTAWLSWQQTGLKRIMAYSTTSALGMLVFLLGLGARSHIAVEAMVVFLVVHSLYKGGLFMIAGNIDHETGSRDITRVHGLARRMPLTLLGTLLAALSMAGIPPLIGFVGKELIYEATLESGVWQAGLTTLAVATNVLMVGAAAIVLLVPFFHRSNIEGVEVRGHEAPWTMWLGPVVLGGLALAAGLLVSSEWVNTRLFGAAATAVLGEPIELHLHLWPSELSPMLILSIITILLGLGVYAVHERVRGMAQRLDGAVSRLGPEAIYQAGLKGFLAGAKWLTHTIQNGYLRYYLMYILVSLVGLVGGTLYTHSATAEGFGLPRFEVQSYEIIVAIVIIGATFMVMLSKGRLAVIAAMGVVGYGVAMMYIFFSAPDLAMTQFAIETLTIILFVLVLYRLPKFVTITAPRDRIRDTLIATAMGLLMTILVLMTTGVRTEKPLSEYFLENSYELAHGHNVVNVILVDFRGLDTMFEVTVLSIAAIGVYGLLQGMRRKNQEQEEESHGSIADS